MPWSAVIVENVGLVVVQIVCCIEVVCCGVGSSVVTWQRIE